MKSQSSNDKRNLFIKKSHERNLILEIKKQNQISQSFPPKFRRAQTARTLRKEEIVEREEEKFFEPPPVFYMYEPKLEKKSLRLSDNPDIFQEDILKLQNLITGAY